MNTDNNVLNKIKGKLVVSCQALPEEPLHSPFIMGRMAYAAYLGGASGIRANSVEDIKEIKTVVDLPIIGIIKRVYEGSDVFITPTLKEVDDLYREGVDIIAMDATDRIRPDGTTISELFPRLREAYKDQLFMADCSTYEEALKAVELGFDCIGTTLSGFTEATRGKILPDFEMVEKLVNTISMPVIAEGGVSTPEELKRMFDLGVYSSVVGSAITRPMEITQRFMKAIQ
ncbi:N-acetylmannosamine-6-phosphate 2-epimerase [Paenibacillus macquariensis]|uniref:Putative N-acetylmannosamine-6-phosphate 2-epimerase n=1 Tax=Paenibacillus macquariensis TaxID=948756 RepID=A0ABY1JLC8_9BACL|nr:N-acetylmannosamine-6-phosphate 2-epimerase [Paenibacillus macquariensis]MEC0090121.1 N-acetylmannosamine-6-phosphate 2-epimerase [Paenibacillus macquariensis]OAB31005.1 N-acetylmannosamine-6-phosphate 2-epimerase [Paenibacillus macquariensis subsp. macquariensis]SIQ38072.1 N-acylglucosamine-6-phosphate 2-epimerase [Paenibacillus macquariensis]